MGEGKESLYSTSGCLKENFIMPEADSFDVKLRTSTSFHTVISHIL
jgi:hypothetical protein